METIGLTLTALAILGGALGTSRTQDARSSWNPAQAELRPSPEMQRLLKTFLGTWDVVETFEVSESRPGQSRKGTARFRAGPGFSLIEDYRSNGSAGELRFLAVLWWDAESHAYRLFTCANNEGCRVRGTARWEGNTLVNTWEEEDQGKRVAYRDSFMDLSLSSLTLLSEGRTSGTTVWHVTTKYTRHAGMK